VLRSSCDDDSSYISKAGGEWEHERLSERLVGEELSHFCGVAACAILPPSHAQDWGMWRVSEENAVGVVCESYCFICFSLILAKKVLHDKPLKNRAFAALGWTVREINDVERCVLEGLGWNLHVSQDEFKEWVVNVASFAKEDWISVNESRA
jgi:hypothetical protein